MRDDDLGLARGVYVAPDGRLVPWSGWYDETGALVVEEHARSWEDDDDDDE